MLPPEFVCHDQREESKHEDEHQVARVDDRYSSVKVERSEAPSSSNQQDLTKNKIECSAISNADQSVQTKLDAATSSKLRAEGNKVYGFFYKIVTSIFFNVIMLLMIITNTVLMASYNYNISDAQADLIEIFDVFIDVSFFLEMVFKVLGLGFRNYLQDRWNVFDAIIVMVSRIDTVVELIGGQNNQL